MSQIDGNTEESDCGGRRAWSGRGSKRRPRDPCPLNWPQPVGPSRSAPLSFACLKSRPLRSS